MVAVQDKHNYLRSLEVISKDNLDVLLLPDVGMSWSSRTSSLLRLAPVQSVGWGHPVTTGSQNIDFYLSSELMEHRTVRTAITQRNL